jgi:hypothetical protein
MMQTTSQCTVAACGNHDQESYKRQAEEKLRLDQKTQKIE